MILWSSLMINRAYSSIFFPDRRLLAYSSIGVPPPRLHCDRAANYGSIIIPLRLSLPDRLRSGLCCNGFIALPFASWRACSLAQRLLTSQRRECICLNAYSVIKVPKGTFVCPSLTSVFLRRHLSTIFQKKSEIP